MIDETGIPNPAAPDPASGNPDAQAPNPEGEGSGFCQDCGRPLTQQTMRKVGSGVFCDPCLERRAGTGPGYGAAYGAGAGYVPPHVPRPAVAGWLGLIPGVGAMYNGQFAKGIAHLLVFAILSSLADHGNGIFGLLCFGWICYQSFEAYHTAKARLLGLPLPNPFGLNDIGERLGFNKGWQYGGQQYGGQRAGTQRPAGTPPASGWSAGSASAWKQPPATPRSDWTGYVPPTAFGAGVPPPVVPTPDSWGSTPYHAAQSAQAAYPPPPQQQPFYQAAPGGAYATPIPAVPAVDASTRRFPAGAIWLIGLGILFLLMNVDARFDLRGSWLVAAILATVAVWSLTRRHSLAQRVPKDADGRARHAVIAVRGPAILLVLAALFVLQGAHWFTLGQTWPILLLALGGLMLAERALPRTDIPLTAPDYDNGFPTTNDAAGGSPTSATASHTDLAETNDSPNDAPKGGL